MIRTEAERYCNREMQEPSRQPASNRDSVSSFDLDRAGPVPSVLVHDFNNLFQIVISALRIVERRPELAGDEDMTFVVKSALQAADKASTLTQRLLELAIAAQPVSRPIRINSVLLALGDLLRTMLGQQIELQLVLRDDLAPVACDARQFEDAVINLAINARDAMPAGGRLRIETYGAELASNDAGLPRGRYFALSVSDTGCGMTPEVARRAFDPFYTTKPVGRGTGLGLASVKTFVEQHNGHVSIETKLGVGTSVRLYLPC